MADSFITYTGDGSTTIFSIPFGYLSADHLTATVDGVETAVTFPTDAQFEFSVAPGNATAVTLTRVTPRDTREVVWQDAANLSAGDLNTSDLQLLYITQEAFDRSTNNIALASDDKWDANNKVIKNVATPVDSSDAATKAYADQNLVLTNADVVASQAARVGAETAEASAQAVLAQMQILYDEWDDRYLGVKTSDPTVDNDGDPLEDGALYFNTTANQLRVYDLGSTTWLVFEAIIVDGSVTNAKLSAVSQNTIKGRVSIGSGDPEDLTPSQGRTVLDVYSTSESDALPGKIVQTVEEIDTSISSVVITNSSWTAGGQDVTITASAGNKVRIHYDFQVGLAAATFLYMSVFKDGVQMSEYVGDVRGSRTPITKCPGYFEAGNRSQNIVGFIDDIADDGSAHTYSFRWRSFGNTTLYFNKISTDSDSSAYFTGVSKVVAEEITQ